MEMSQDAIEQRRHASVTTTAMLRELLDKVDAAYPNAVVLPSEGGLMVLCDSHRDRVGNIDVGLFPDFWDFNAEDG